MEIKQIIKEKQNFKFLRWSKLKNSSGPAGSFLKAYSIISGKKQYYKLSNYDSIKGIIGIESVNEIIVDRLLSLLGIEHVNYKLINADIIVDEKVLNTYLCVSEDFKDQNEDKIALDCYYDIEHKKGEDVLTFCIRNGWESYIYEMLVVDFIILNRDRHGANIEVLRNKKKKTIRLAPLFDHGLSLLFNCYTNDEIKNFDIMEDKRVNSYIGGRSTKDNLNLIPVEKLPKLNNLTKEDKNIIFKDLDGILSKELIDKTWEMIINRWSYYENFCNTRQM